MKIFEIILVLILAVFSIITASNWKTINRIKKIFLIASILAAFIIGWNAIKDFKKQQLLEKINASFGELVDTKVSQLPIIEIGDGGARFKLGISGLFSFPPYSNLFKVFVKENRLYINIILRNREGEVIAVIYENIWTMYSDNYEYNDDENAFEIVTRGDRKVFFQIDLKEGIAHIAGFIINENGYGLYFYPVGENKGALMTPIIPEKKFSPVLSIEIQQIFKYPRSKYYGIRTND